jgi:excisionase family DNA binding protein
MHEKYGLEVTAVVLENVSVPPEVEQAIDKRSSMGVIGNLNDYVKYQMGQAMGQGGDAAAAATVPATMAMGFGMAQEMMRSMQQPQAGAAPQAAAAPAATATPDVLTPEQAAQLLSVSVEDVMASIQSGDLKARRIGNAWRISKAALDEFLRG